MMKKIIFIFALVLISLIALQASEKITKSDSENVNSTSSFSFNLSENLKTTDAATDYAATTSGASGEAQFYAFCYKYRNLFLGLGIGLSAGVIVGLSLGIAGAAIWGYYYTNYLTILSTASNKLSPLTALNYYYAGTALLVVGWLLFSLCIFPAAGSWVMFAFSFHNRKASLDFELYPNGVALAMKF
jgi:hypothetical protein